MTVQINSYTILSIIILKKKCLNLNWFLVFLMLTLKLQNVLNRNNIKITKYLEIFEIDTKIIKVLNLVFIVPAINVIGSPITGIQDNNKLPFFIFQKPVRCINFFLI